VQCALAFSGRRYVLCIRRRSIQIRLLLTRSNYSTINVVDFYFFFLYYRSVVEVFFCLSLNYGRPLSVSGRPCYILPMFFFIFIFFYGRLILRPWLTEVRESFTRGGP